MEGEDRNNVEPAWHDIPKRLHPVRCGGCNESWFCRTLGNGGNNERDFWPRFCCYCGMRFIYTNPEDPDGTPHPPVLMDGTPKD